MTRVSFCSVFVLCAACTGAPQEETGPLDTGPSTPVATLAQAMATTCPDGGSPAQPYPNALKPGDDLHKLTLSAPEATCNDGSQAVLFVRPATTAANANRWVFYIQGGSSCGTYEECQDRYCGDAGIYDASKMSADFTPETIGGSGIQRASADNPFADANQVYVYYCSSDQWTGQRSGAVLTSADGASQYTADFRGHSILDAMVTQLQGGPTSSDDGTQDLPSLSDATIALWTGVSAGSTGATLNADWFASRFTPANTEVYGVFDAGFGPVAEDSYDPAIAATIDTRTRDRWQSTFLPLYDAFVDTSCADHPANAGDNAARCSDATYVKLNHVTTPFFQRLDLRDSVGSRGPLSVGATLPEFAAGAIDALTSLSEIRTTALEADAIERVPGVYGPNCGQHVAITNNDFFLHTTVDGPGGAPVTFADALQRWLSGAAVTVIDEDPRATSVCAPVTDDYS